MAYTVADEPNIVANESNAVAVAIANKSNKSNIVANKEPDLEGVR